MFQSIWFASVLQLVILYLMHIATAIYLFRKYKRDSFYSIIIFIFYPAIFAFIGKNFIDLHKIISLVLILRYSFKNKIFHSLYKGDGYILAFFALYSITFMLSAIKNGDGWIIILSQFSRYIIIICLWFIIRQRIKLFNLLYIEKLKRFAYDLILMQIIITIWKIIIFQGQQIESIVGSLSHTGGAIGTSLPILGLIIYWIYNKEKIDRKSIYFILGLFLIGFITGKRAVIFILPIVIAALTMYIPRKGINKNMLLGILLVPFIFYLGLRLTPTLNPEAENWGSFSPTYAYDYAMAYQYGSASEGIQAEHEGRGGATNAVLERVGDFYEFSSQDWFGVGLSEMYTTDYASFTQLGLGLDHKGSATGIFQTYVTNGYLGIIGYVLFFFSMIFKIKRRRFKIVIIAILAWEYFLYTGIIFRMPALMFLVIFSIHYTNWQYYQGLRKRITNA